MTSASAASRTASRAKNSTWLEVLTRAGLVGYGLLHLAIAWLAVQLAVGHFGDHADQAGAFRLLEQQPLGHTLLVVIAIGLAAMALWQLLLAAGSALGSQPRWPAALSSRHIDSLRRSSTADWTDCRR